MFSLKLFILFVLVTNVTNTTHVQSNTLYSIHDEF